MAPKTSTINGVDAARRLARRLGLRHVSDSERGIERRRNGTGFVYFHPDGRRVRDAAVLQRIRAAAIPPAYADVWICSRPEGHIQATARDARGRKQYRYHPRWEDVRATLKYSRMLEFGMALPRLRRRITALLRKKGMPREKVLAAVLRLLEVTLIRVGNEEYARKNRSYGLTTLANRHAEVSGNTIHFDFRGKSGVPHSVEVEHPILAGIVREGLELPGRELFQYFDKDGGRHAVSSADVNAFLQEIAGTDFTAKDYRTWAGSVYALAELRRRPRPGSEREARKHIVETVRAVTARLGNTPAICRKSYIHPGLFDAYRAGKLPAGASSHGLTGDEAAFLRFLKRYHGAPHRWRRRSLRQSAGAVRPRGM
jgi:DNA topoisomerase-1